MDNGYSFDRNLLSFFLSIDQKKLKSSLPLLANYANLNVLHWFTSLHLGTFTFK